MGIWQRVHDMLRRYHKKQTSLQGEEEKAFFEQWNQLQDERILVENRFNCNNDIYETDGWVYALLSTQKRFDALIRKAKNQGLKRDFQLEIRPWEKRAFDHTVFLNDKRGITQEKISDEEKKEKKKEWKKGGNKDGIIG